MKLQKIITVFIIFIFSLFTLLPTIFAIDEEIANDDDIENEDIIRVPADTMWMSPKLYSFKVPRHLDGIMGVLQGIVDQIIATALAQAVAKFGTVKPDGTFIETLEQKYRDAKYRASTKPLKPLMVQDKTRNALEQPNRKYNISGRICVYRSGEGLIGEAITTKMIRTVNNQEHSIQGDQASRELVAMMGKGVYQMKQNEKGEYNMKRKDYRTKKDAPLPCDMSVDTTSTNTRTDGFSGLHQFDSLGGWINPGRVFNLAVEILRKAGILLPEENISDSELCDAWFGGCDEITFYWKASYASVFERNECNTGTGSDGCYAQKAAQYPVSKAEAESGGFDPTFMPAVFKETVVEGGPGGDSDQCIDASGTRVCDENAQLGKRAKQDSNRFIYCMMSPLSKQAGFELVDYNPNGNSDDPLLPTPNPTPCIYEPSETARCGEWESKLGDSGGACGICNAPIGDLAKKILTAAGTAFNVPAANIWAAMLHEGGDHPEFGTFSDDDVRKWSNSEECGGEPMPSCDNNNPITQAPFGFLEYWFYLGDGADALWTAVQEIDPTRDSKEKVSRCNFLDAAFAAAKLLHQGAAQTLFPSCGGYTGFTPVRPGTCSSAFWTDTKVAQSQIGYAGSCVDDDPNHLYTNAQAVGWYHAASCQ